MSRVGHARAIDSATGAAHSCAPKRIRHFRPSHHPEADATTKPKGEARMKSKRLTCIIAVALLAVATPISLAAQDKAKQNHTHKYHHYQLNDVGTFGGPNSSYLQAFPVGRMLNNSGTAVGSADTPTPDPYCASFNFDCYVGPGFKWQNGVTSALSALPGFNGLNSATGLWVSDSGLTVGVSENGIDPLTGAFAIEAVLWGTDNSLTDLGTLGGNQSSANAVNSRGQVAGGALNTIPDPYTNFFLPAGVTGETQVHAFRWSKSRGMEDMGTLGGTDSAAFAINDRGQIAGWSFTNTTPNPSTGVPTLDPFLWENGKMLDLGTLGGTFGQAWALNNRGQVVGFSGLPGDSGDHAFLWDHTGGMQDLGTLGGDTGEADAINDAGDIVGGDSRADGSGGSFLWRHGVMTDLGTVVGANIGSQALGINSRRQIVGNLLDNVGNEIGGFLWEDGGPMVDLSTLIPPNPDLQLDHAFQINDRGEIAVRGVFSNGDIHSFVLIPCDENHAGIEGCDYSLVDASTASRVSPAPAIQHPAALTPHRPMLRGMLNHSRFSRGQRPTGFGTLPAPDSKPAIPADTVTDYLEADNVLGPQWRGGYCIVFSGRLTGYCSKYSYYSCLAKPSSFCPSGQIAKKPGYYSCSNTRRTYVDLGRGCS
jgi:probable HAF family extracellular repeat protein